MENPENWFSRDEAHICQDPKQTASEGARSGSALFAVPSVSLGHITLW